MVVSGGTSLNPLLSSGGRLALQAGVVESGGTVGSGATLFVSSGVSVSGMTILAGGSLVILSGGSDLGVIDHGTVVVSSGAVESGDSFSGGAQLLESVMHLA